MVGGDEYTEPYSPNGIRRSSATSVLQTMSDFSAKTAEAQRKEGRPLTIEE